MPKTTKVILNELEKMQLRMRTVDDFYNYMDNLKQLIINDYGSLKNLRINTKGEQALSDIRAYSNKIDYVLVTLLKNRPHDELKRFFGKRYTTKTLRDNVTKVYGFYKGATYNAIKNLDKIVDYIKSLNFSNKEFENAILISNDYILAKKDTDARETNRSATQINTEKTKFQDIDNTKEHFSFMENSELNDSFYSSTNDLYSKYKTLKFSEFQVIDQRIVTLKTLHELSKANKNKGFFNKLFHPSLNAEEKRQIAELKQILRDLNTSEEEITKASNPRIAYDKDTLKNIKEEEKESNRKNFEYTKKFTGEKKGSKAEIWKYESKHDKKMIREEEEIEEEIEESKQLFETKEEESKFFEDAYENKEENIIESNEEDSLIEEIEKALPEEKII